jgi:hypothetical protein
MIMRLLSYQLNGEQRYGAAANHGIVDLTGRIGSDFPDLKALIAADGLSVAKRQWLAKLRIIRLRL